MNAQSISDIGHAGTERSINSYLRRQSRKSIALFEGREHISNITSHQQEWLRMEERLQQSRERIEQMVLAMKMASGNNAAQLDDEHALQPTIST